jgi:hypothetical protein
VLAERERARLVEKARLAEFDVAELRRAVEHDFDLLEPEPATHDRDLRAVARRTFVPAVLGCSLFANGILASLLVTHGDGRHVAANATPPAASVTATLTRALHAKPKAPAKQKTLAKRPTKRRTTRRPRTIAPRRLPEKTIAEQKLVALILQAPARKLPRRFIDPKTGLVRNNVRVVCRLSTRRSYLCTIRLPGDAAGRGIRVRYRRARSGKELFTWYGDTARAGAVRSGAKS